MEITLNIPPEIRRLLIQEIENDRLPFIKKVFETEFNREVDVCADEDTGVPVVRRRDYYPLTKQQQFLIGAINKSYDQIIKKLS